jgi:PAS domain S-box-containing protein
MREGAVLIPEAERLAVLQSYAILDTPPEAAFDELVQAAARICGAPMAAVSLVDETRQWFKARVGLSVDETPRDVSFCDHAMWQDDLFVILDATRDPRFAQNALVTGDPNIRFYAGAAIRSPEGVPLGALCVLDDQTRTSGFTEEQAMVLRVLANQVEAQLKLRQLVAAQMQAVTRQAHQISLGKDREDRLLKALSSAEVGWWDWDVVNDRVVANTEMASIFGIESQTAFDGVPISQFFSNVHTADRPALRDSIDYSLQTGEPFREEYRLLGPAGRVIWVSARGRALRDEAGKVTTFPGVVIEISDRKNAEARGREADMGRELALAAARLGWFDHKPDKGERFYDARAMELMGVTRREVSTVENTLKHIHPDDRPSVERGLQNAVDPKRSGPFRQTFRVLLPNEERWIAANGRTQFENGVCTRFMGVLEDVTEQVRADQHRQLLANELNHRVKNTLAVMQSLVDSTLRAASDSAEARVKINARIRAYGRAHDLLTASNWSAAPVGAIVDGVVANLSLPRERLEIDGPAVSLGPQPALQLALTLHELATNALKYGALSNDTGRLSIHWSIGAEGNQFHLSWQERGGPTVAPPARKGFGSQLIERATAGAFSGKVTLDYNPSGVHWRLEAPYAGLAESGRAPVSE